MAALTQKQENFCLSYVAQGNASAAYRTAYNADNMGEESIRVEAYKVMSRPHVSLRIEQLKAAAAKRNEITVDDLIAELEEARQVALSAETPQTSAAIAGTMGKAKLLGMDKQVMEHQGPGGKPLFDKIEVVVVNAALRDSQ